MEHNFLREQCIVARPTERAPGQAGQLGCRKSEGGRSNGWALALARWRPIAPMRARLRDEAARGAGAAAKVDRAPSTGAHMGKLAWAYLVEEPANRQAKEPGACTHPGARARGRRAPKSI